MEKRFHWLEPSEIDASDETFRVRRRYPKGLGESIRLRGIRVPLIVEPLSPGICESHRLISGWGRWQERPAEGPLPTFVLPYGLSISAVWDVFLRDNERWNPVEIARVLERLHTLAALSEAVIVREKMRFLGGRSSKDLFRQYRSLLELCDKTLDFIEEEGLPLRRTTAFFKIPREARADVVDTARALKLSMNELAEALEMLEEIAHREGASVERILEEASADGRGANREAFRAYLRRRRFPQLATYLKRLEHLREELAWSVPVQLQWDPQLERPGMRCVVDWKNAPALDAFLSELQLNKDGLSRLLEIL